MLDEINRISNLIIKEEDKSIVYEILLLLNDKQLSISHINKILNETKKVLPMIATLNIED